MASGTQWELHPSVCVSTFTLWLYTLLNVCALGVWLMLSMAECLCVSVCLSFLSLRHQPEAVFQLGNGCGYSLQPLWIPALVGSHPLDAGAALTIDNADNCQSPITPPLPVCLCLICLLISMALSLSFVLFCLSTYYSTGISFSTWPTHGVPFLFIFFHSLSYFF